MKLTETIKLYPTGTEKTLILGTMHTYIDTVNQMVFKTIDSKGDYKPFYKDIKTDLPSALRTQCLRDVQTFLRKYEKACRKAAFKNKKFEEQGNPKRVEVKIPAMKRPCCFVNNQNFKIKDSRIEFPVWLNGKSVRLSIPTKITEKQKKLLSEHKLGTLRIIKRKNSILAQVSYEMPEPSSLTEGNVMGVDLGIKCPAVSRCSDGNIRFYGNGRKNKQMRRFFSSKRKKLQKAKHMDAVKHLDSKEQRIMKDIDHKISRQIVKQAEVHNVKVIKLECLKNIHSTTRTSRKNNHSLHNWSFYRLANYIEYKARLAGIKVIYVNPAYTSQRCPFCGLKNHAKDRHYKCTCGFESHRDVVGAWNIQNSTEYVGNRRTA